MPALILTLLCTAELVLFLLPGIATVAVISRKRGFPERYSLLGAITVSAIYGYLAFWIYFANKTAGQAFSYVILVASIITLSLVIQRKRPLFLLDRDFIIPIAYAFSLALFYLSLLYLWVNPLKAGVDVANVRFFQETRPGDNIIPFIFAERIYDRAPIRPFCCGDWLSSDRPPLQAGLFLLQRPLRVAGNTGLQYQVLGTVLQCLWVCGAWQFLVALGATRARIVRAIGLLAFSGFLFYNSVYVWPKLLAACFILFVFALLARAAIERRTLSRLELVLLACSFVLALLAHPGSVFSVPAMAVLWLMRRKIVSVKQAVLAGLIVVAALAPWTLYQNFYDPPGNRLLKMHLAGVIPPDSRSMLQALRDAYGQLDAETILQNKWRNVETLIKTDASHRGLRSAQREYVLEAIGVLALGALLALIRRHPKLPYSGTMLSFSGLNLLVWCLVLFGPGQTVTEHGSYADLLLLSLGFIGFLLALRPVALLLVLAVQVVNLIFVWVAFRPNSFTLPTRAVVAPSIEWSMLALAVMLGTALIWRFARVYLRSELTSPVTDALIEQKPQ